MRPGIRSNRLETTREPPLELHLQGVVVGRSGIANQLRVNEVGIGCRHPSALQQAPPGSSQIGRAERLSASESLLKRNIPFERVRLFEFRVKGQDAARG